MTRLWPLLIAVSCALSETVTLPVTIAAANGCRHDTRRAEALPAVPVPGPDGAIVLAGAPVRASLDPEAPATGDDGLPDAGYLRYDFQVPASATYTIWALVATPQGRSRFVEIVDGNRIAAHFEELNEKSARPAHWVERPKVALTAGLHRFAVASFGYQMARVTSLVLAPAGYEPTGDGPQPVTAVPTGVRVETAEITVPGLRRVKRLAGAPNAAVSWSTDGGQSWQPFPAAGADTSAPVRFRLALTPGAAAGPLAVEVEVADGRLAVVAAGGVELVLDRVTGDFFLLRTAAGELLAGGLAARPLVAVDFKRRGEAVWYRVDPRGWSKLVPKEKYSRGVWDTIPESQTAAVVAPEKVVVGDGKAEIVHVLTAPEVGRCRVTQRIEADPDGSFRMTADVQSLDGPADVVVVTYPTLPAVRLSGDGLDDVQLRMQSFGDRTVQPGRAPLRDELYSGGVVMNWSQVYDADASLYLGAHDPAGTTTLHGSETSGAEADQVGLFLRRYDEIEPGRSATWSTCLAVGPGGWHAGARRYGDWFTKTHGPAVYSDFLRTCDGWLDLQIENYGREFRFDSLGDWLSIARASGLDWVQCWGQFAYDGGPCCGAWYGPSPLYGGLAGWKQACAEIRRRKGLVGGYFHYAYVDRLPTFFATFLGRFGKQEFDAALPWDTAEGQHKLLAVLDPAGTVPPVKPSQAELDSYAAKIAEHRKLYADGQRAAPVMWWEEAYIPDPAWRKWLADWIVDRYAKEYGCTGTYIDVLGTGRCVIDYDPRRGNNGDGQWGNGRLLLAKEVSERGRKLDPAFSLTMEGLADQPGLYAAAMCSGVYRGERNVYRYTFPDRVLIHGMANAGSGDTYYNRLMTSFQEVLRYDLAGRPNALAMSLLTLMRHFTPDLWLARFVDTEGLAVSDRRVVARHLVAGEGSLRGHFLTVTNPAACAAELKLDAAAFDQVATAFEVGLDGAVTAHKLRWQAGAATVPVSGQPASLWYLPTQPGPPVHAVAWLKRDAPAAVEVTVLNLTDQRRAGRCEIANRGWPEPFEDRRAESAAALPTGQAGLAFDLPPAGLQTLRFPIASLAALRWSTWLEVSVDLDGRRTRRTVLVPPLALDGSFELLSPGGTDAVEGRHCVELGPTTEGYLHRTVELWLHPERRYKLSVKARRTGFTAAVSGTLLRLSPNAENVYEDHRWGLDAKRPNEWQTLGGEFTTPRDLTRALLYLYNVRSPDTAWFDDLRLEDLGPAPRAKATP